MPWAIPRRTIYSYPGMGWDVIRSLFCGQWVTGDEVSVFEKEFAVYTGVKHAVAVPSARVGLELILQALDLPPGHRIAVPAYTADCIPVSIQAAGHIPVFVDIDPRDHNISVQALDTLARQGIHAAIITHLFGRPCRMDDMTALAREHGFLIIEDFSHATGASFQGKKAGALGTVGFCTFSTTKFFNTLGGGMITTSDSSLAMALQALTHALPKPTHARLARAAAIAALMHMLTSPLVFSTTIFPVQLLLSRLSSDMLHIYNRTLHQAKEPRGPHHAYANLQARLGRRWLQILDEQNRMRAHNAARLNQLLDPSIRRLEDPPGGESIYWLYMLLVDNPSVFSRMLLQSGIDTGKFFMDNCADASFVHTQDAVQHTLQIPLRPDMTEADVQRLAQAINRAHRKLHGTTPD